MKLSKKSKKEIIAFIAPIIKKPYHVFDGPSSKLQKIHSLLKHKILNFDESGRKATGGKPLSQLPSQTQDNFFKHYYHDAKNSFIVEALNKKAAFRKNPIREIYALGYKASTVLNQMLSLMTIKKRIDFLKMIAPLLGRQIERANRLAEDIDNEESREKRKRLNEEWNRIQEYIAKLRSFYEKKKRLYLEKLFKETNSEKDLQFFNHLNDNLLKPMQKEMDDEFIKRRDRIKKGTSQLFRDEDGNVSDIYKKTMEELGGNTDINIEQLGLIVANEIALTKPIGDDEMLAKVLEPKEKDEEGDDFLDSFMDDDDEDDLDEEMQEEQTKKESPLKEYDVEQREVKKLVLNELVAIHAGQSGIAGIGRLKKAENGKLVSDNKLFKPSLVKAWAQHDIEIDGEQVSYGKFLAREKVEQGKLLSKIIGKYLPQYVEELAAYLKKEDAPEELKKFITDIEQIKGTHFNDLERLNDKFQVLIDKTAEIERGLSKELGQEQNPYKVVKDFRVKLVDYQKSLLFLRDSSLRATQSKEDLENRLNRIMKTGYVYPEAEGPSQPKPGE